MISAKIGRVVGGWKSGLASSIGDLGVHPNVLTSVGVLVNLAAAWVICLGQMKTAGFVIVLASVFDMIDGAVARTTGRQSRFGAFFDSVMDRYSDMLIFIGLVGFFARTGSVLGIALTCSALAGTIMVSYCRARAENGIPQCKVGFWERPERLVLLILGAFTGRILAAVAILAVFTHLTVFHRMVHTFDVCREIDGRGPGRKPASPEGA